MINVGPDRPEIKASTQSSHKVRETRFRNESEKAMEGADFVSPRRPTVKSPKPSSIALELNAA